jgi:opacity protein-like surface antigen
VIVMRAALAAALIALVATPARAQSEQPPEPGPGGEPEAVPGVDYEEGPDAGQDPEPEADPDADGEPGAGAESGAGAEPDGEPDSKATPAAAGDQALAASLGLELGGRLSPGGLHVAGAYLYRLTENDWFDGGLSFTFGSGQAACFRDREDDFVCDHGPLDGFGAELFGGLRRYFPGQGRFTPYGRAAVGVRRVGFGDDDVTGWAVPLQLGGGVRATIAERMTVSAGIDLRVGPAWFNRELDSQPHLGLAVHGGFEYQL